MPWPRAIPWIIGALLAQLAVGCNGTPPAGVGEPCDRDGDCADEGVCLHLGEEALCTVECAAQADCEAWGFYCGLVDGEGALCRPPVGEGGQDAPCRDHDECRSGLCVLQACAVLCTDACDEGRACREETFDVAGTPYTRNVCLEIVENEVETFDYPDVVIPAPYGASLEVVARRGTMSFMVLVEGDPALYYALSDLWAPDGTVLVDHDLGGPNAILPSKGVFTALVPDTDAAGGRIQTGAYGMFVIAFDDGGRVVPSSASVRILVKRRDEASLGSGRLDLQVVIAQGAKAGVDASTAASDAEIGASLEKLGAYVRQAGIEIGDVAYADAPASLASLDSDAELAELLGLCGSGCAGRLVFSFVASMTGVSGSPAGWSGGIPGPPGIPGTQRSGIAVAFQGDESLTADTLCHEAGHYLGLFHTSELYSESVETLHDPISDTAECELRTPEDMDACPARTNLMFPLLNGLQDTLTAGQGAVIRNNILVY
jgi:hypothetical protein